MSKKGNSVLVSLITTIIIVGGLVLVYFGVSARMKEVVEPKVKEVDKVLSRNLETDYPDSPAGVVRHYYEIYTVIYSGNAVSRTSDLVWQERGLFTKELQILNPYEIQVENVLEEIAMTQAGGDKLLTYEILDVYQDSENEKIFYVDVVEYWTGAVKVNKKYALFQEDNNWKIHRWDIIENE